MPAAPAVTQVLPAPVAEKIETVPERNLRVFQAEVLPKQLVALKGLVMGDGEVVLLCYRDDEDDLRYWHPLDTGFAGRRPLEDL